MDLLAVLGRGIRTANVKAGEDTCYTLGGARWYPTDDFEAYSENSTHLGYWEKPDDDNPHCYLGGGKLNLEAATVLIRAYRPKICVCAYGMRSEYLQPCDPSESLIMCHWLVINGPLYVPTKYEAWPENKVVPSPSNTYRELQNVFEYATEKRLSHIGIVTIAAHLPRAQLFGAKLLTNPAFRKLKVRWFASEYVLLNADIEEYSERVATIFSSKAFRRTALLEEKGIKAFLTGRYGATS